MADAKATFAVELQDQTSRGASSAASGLEKLRQKIQQDEAAVRNLQSALGRLKGATSDVSATKKELTARLGAAKASVGNAQASFLKLGGNLDALKDKNASVVAGSAKASDGFKKQGDSATAAGGAAGGASKTIIKSIVAATLAIVAAYGWLQKFALEAFNTARNLRITAEAFTGSAQNADALATHLAALSGKVPQTRAELQGIAEDLSESGLAGNNLVTSMRAVATAAAVLPGAAGKIKAIAEAAVNTKRLTIGLFDLKGTGLTLNDVASELAAKLHTNLAEAKAALVQGRVGIDSGLQALDAAVEKRFGALARRKALSLESLAARAKEGIGNLFSKINFEPLLTAFDELIGLLDESTSTGKAIRGLFQNLFNMGPSVTSTMPIVKGFIKGLVLGAMMVEIGFYRVRGVLKRCIPPSLKGDIDGVTIAITAGKVAAIAFAVAIGAVAIAATALVVVVLAPFILLGGAIAAIVYAIKRFGPSIKDAVVKAANWIKDKIGAAIDFLAGLPAKCLQIGKDIVNQLAHGMEGAIPSVQASADELQAAILERWKTMGIQVPTPGGPPGAPGGPNKPVAFKTEAPNGGVIFASAKTAPSQSTQPSQPGQTFVFHGMGAQDRQWFERKVLGVLKGAANGAGLNPGEVAA